MVEFTAYCEQAIPRLKLLQELVHILPHVASESVLQQKDLAPLFKKLRTDAFLLEQYGAVAVSPVFEELAIRDALASGRSNTYQQSSFAADPFAAQRYGFHLFRTLQRQFRAALYTGDSVEMGHAYDLYLKESKSTQTYSTPPLTQILAASDNFSFLEKGPAAFFIRHLPLAIEATQLEHSQLMRFTDPILTIADDFFPINEIADTSLRDSMLTLMLLHVGECWLCNEMSNAESVISQMTGYQQMAAMAVLAFAENRIEDAVGLFEKALRELRKTTRKKRFFFNNLIGEIFIYACLRLDTPAIFVRLKELLEDAASRTNKSPYQSVFEQFEALVEARLYPDKEISLPIYRLCRDDIKDIEIAIAGIMAHTMYDVAAVRKKSRVVEYLKTSLNQLNGTPHVQFLANVQALYHHIIDTPVPDNEDIPMPMPTFDFSRSHADWKLVLYNISRIGNAVQPQNTDAKESGNRLSFRIAWYGGNDRWSLHAYVQKPKKGGGFTKGKYFDPARRLDTEVDTSFFTRTDERILMIMESERERYRRTSHGMYRENFNEALYRLAGHPAVFRDDEQLAPLEIETASPQVEVTSVGDNVEIRVCPSNPCERGYHVERRSANLIRVTRFTKAQLELLEALGQNGARFPAKAKTEIADAVTHISALAEVHSHVPNIGKKSVEVPTCDVLLLRMHPFLHGLSAQFLVSPLGEKGPTFVPGHGPEHVFATVGIEKRTTARDLQAESRQLDALLMVLGLFYSEESGEGLYQFPDEALAIEFLSELENCKATDGTPPFQVEWPKGVKLKCTRTLFPKDFHLLINKKRKWLSLSGRIKVSDKELYEIAELTDMMDTPKQGYMRLKDGQFLRLSKSLRQFLLHLKGVGVLQSDGSILAPENAVISVRRLSDEAGEFEANLAWEKQVAHLDRSLCVESTLPNGVKATFRDYQMDGYRWLHRLSTLGLGACLADDMGLGKTLQTLAIMLHRLQQRAMKKPALIVAPVSVIPGWFAEARRFVPDLKLIHYAGQERDTILANIKARQVLVTSYGLLQRDGQKLARIEFDMIVLDEAQFIKNKDSARAKAAFKLQGDFKMVTTGTPVENRLSEFWSIFHFINPGLLGPHKLFADMYEKCIQQFGDPHALESLRWQVKPFLLRRTKEETLDELPPKTEIVRYCEMSKEESAFYELHRRQAQNLLKLTDSNQQMMELITALTTLRQAACHPRLIEPSLTMESAKLNCLKDILEELKSGGHRALVFSQFVKFLTIVREWLDEQNITYQYLDGSSSQKQRTEAVDAFQTGHFDLFVISTRAGGFGLNLTAADYVVHLDPWWNPAVEDQASDRVHRIGQSRPVTVYKLVTQGTVEEKVMEIHGEKRDLASGLLENTASVAKLNMNELMSLI